MINNLTTGEIIKINKNKDIGIFYTIYENSYCFNNNLYGIEKNTVKRNTNIVPDIPMNEEDLIEYTASLKILESETDFIINEDTQNWIISERPIRMFMKNDFVNEVLLKAEHQALATILNREIDANKIAENKFIFINERLKNDNISKGKTTVAYFFQIDGTDYPIVLPYIYDAELNPTGQIFVENKL